MGCCLDFHTGDYHKLRTEFQVRRSADGVGSEMFSTSLMLGTIGAPLAEASV